MNTQKIRTSDMGQWSIIIRRCMTLQQAMETAQEFLLQTQHISLWPVAQNHWLVIVRRPILLN